MRRFVFGLEPLLKHRKTLEDNERSALFQIHKRLHNEQQHQKQLQRSYNDTLNELSTNHKHGVEQSEVQWFQKYIDRLSEEIGRSRSRIVEAEQKLVEQKETLVEASRKTKVLEVLKVRREKEYRVRVEKEDAKILDELVITRYRRP